MSLCESTGMMPSRYPPDRTWTRREIEAFIADGRKIIILDGHVIKADAWLPYHPGGDKAILHMVGRDGTDEIRALHSQGAIERMRKFVIGKVEGRWTNFTPPIQGGTFRSLAEEHDLPRLVEIEDRDASTASTSTRASSPLFDAIDGESEADASSLSSISAIFPPTVKADRYAEHFHARTAEEISADLNKYPSLSPSSQDEIIARYRQLNSHLYAAGLYKCPYGSYAVECLRYGALFLLSLISLYYSRYALSGFFLGLFWHQLVFTAHDAGHMGITHNFHVDTCIGIFIADFLGGLSIGWWKRSHNVHHIVTNSPEHDPDIEHMPFFAISHRFFSSLRSTYHDRLMPFDAVARLAIKYQDYLYYPLLTLGRFNLYVQSWTYLLSSTQAPRKGPAWWHRYLELIGQFFFWFWFGYLIIYLSIPTARDRVIFILVSHMVTAPLHVQITLSHFAMSTSNLGPNESFPQKMLRTTMDVECPPWLDFLHGGLQFQAIHHLFPRIPRHNLRKAQPFVIQFCEEVGIPYERYGFVRGNKEVLGRLGEVAAQVKIFEECRRVAAGEFLSVHHNH